MLLELLADDDLVARLFYLVNDINAILELLSLEKRVQVV